MKAWWSWKPINSESSTAWCGLPDSRNLTCRGRLQWCRKLKRRLGLYSTWGFPRVWEDHGWTDGWSMINIMQNNSQCWLSWISNFWTVTTNHDRVFMITDSKWLLRPKKSSLQHKGGSESRICGRWRRHDRSAWAISAWSYTRIFLGQRWFRLLFVFYQHLEIISQSIKPNGWASILHPPWPFYQSWSSPTY